MTEHSKRVPLRFMFIEPGPPWEHAGEKPPLQQAGDTLRALESWKWTRPRIFTLYLFRRRFTLAISRRTPF